MGLNCNLLNIDVEPQGISVWLIFQSVLTCDSAKQEELETGLGLISQKAIILSCDRVGWAFYLFYCRTFCNF